MNVRKGSGLSVRFAAGVLCAALACGLPGCGLLDFVEDDGISSDENGGSASGGQNAAGAPNADDGSDANGGKTQGDDSLTADKSGNSGAGENAAGSAGGAEDEERTETITVKADAAGAPESAVRKLSDDDMEEKLSQQEIDALPFAVTVHYYLNDQELSADEIAGKSGPVRIRFTYENKAAEKQKVDDKEVETIVPYAFVSMAILPEDHFTNVEVENGNVSQMQDNRIAFGYAVPGLEDVLSLDALDDALDRLEDDLEELKDDEDEDDDAGDKNDEDEDDDAGDKNGEDKEDEDKDAGDKSGEDKEDEDKDAGDKSGEDKDAGDKSGQDKEDEDKDTGEKGSSADDDDERIPSYVEITADAEKFRLDFTATIVTNGLFADTEDDTVDDLKGMIDDL
ncbi:MAG: hypothetical protein IJV04_05695, partial [Lachnospiraceae bacterium]|nr:hypothetical protein [Lachnospiraceae bacterium]